MTKLDTLAGLNAKVGDKVRYHTFGCDPGNILTIASVRGNDYFAAESPNGVCLSSSARWEMVERSTLDLTSDLRALAEKHGFIGFKRFTLVGRDGNRVKFKHGEMSIKTIGRGQKVSKW